MSDILKTMILLTVIFSFIFIVAIGLSSFMNLKSGNVAIIPISGEIVTDDFGFGVVRSDTVISLLEQADSDPNVKVIVLKINSPGGTVVATDEISEKLGSISKPKIAWIREIGTSGAYWIASFSDVIIANPSSITGSIGVSSSYLEFSETFEKYGVDYIRLISAPEKDIGSPFREPTSGELSKFKKDLEGIHEQFIDVVANNRGLSRNVVEGTRGSFFLGKEAYEMGFVDKLGNKPVVEEVAKELGNLTVVEFVEYEHEINLLETLMSFYLKSPFDVDKNIRIEAK